MKDRRKAVPDVGVPIVVQLARLAQIFMLRRNWLGSIGNRVMVITTLGRQSNRAHTAPIGYVRDGTHLVALSTYEQAGWFRDARYHPRVTLDVKGHRLKAQAHQPTSPVERQRLFELFKAEQPDSFRRYFSVAPDAEPEALALALANHQFMRFQIIA